ncbi:MAG: 1-deoxy-D-xylulose-5-phosphate reductoisomerase [Veillonellales bacterium]
MRHIAILGSTGSIGRQALDVIAANPNRFAVSALAALQKDQLLETQIEKFHPDVAVLVDKQAADRLARRYQGTTKILAGEEGLLEAATYHKADTVLTAIVGFAGLKPTMAAIRAGKTIALANKETLVSAGEIVTAAAKANHVSILPVDSEHSAILQCLQGEENKSIRRLLVTASGGPFRGFTTEQLENVSVEDCLCHPTWTMGRKITVDSATLANKGLEVMEAKWLFDIDYDQIEVVVHPQSMIHSMVEFVDGAVMAQLGRPDMRVPIQYALTYPERITADFPKMDFKTLSALTFESPDKNTFPALALAYQAGRVGGTLPCVFNAANEVAVYAFLQEKIGFSKITAVVKETMHSHSAMQHPDIEAICTADFWARHKARELVKMMK